MAVSLCNLLEQLVAATGGSKAFQLCADVLAAAPQLMGLSRKSFLAPVTGHDVPAERDFATVAANALAIASGADVIRVHDAQAGVDAARVADAALKHNPNLLIR
jgi:dihydropteroate synthase